MSRSDVMSRLRRAMRVALFCERRGLSTAEGLDLAKASESAGRRSRRDFLAGSAAALAATGVGLRAHAVPAASVDVGIVGAGLAGLACADTFRTAGVVAKIYEAGDRVGGRCWSNRTTFAGQNAEMGGELIDNLHKTMLGYAQRFNLAREDYLKDPGDISYFFDGQLVPEADIVDEYRAFVATMHDDLRACSGAPTADTHSDADVALDFTNLAEYLSSRGAGHRLTKAVRAAYEAEYGLRLEDQSSLNFLLFIHHDKRSKFTPFGVWSDERWHLTGGNDAITTSLAAGQSIELGMRLIRVKKDATGRYELTFKQGNKTLVRKHDVVVLAIPFSVLRGVDLDASLELPAWKLAALQMGYGTNAKNMVGFTSRPWLAAGSNGTSYSNLANHQTTWETNAANATSTRAVLTDYASGPRGASFDPAKIQSATTAFLTDLDRIYPGAKSAARVSGGKYVAAMAAWPKNPLSQGSYTAYRPGEFVTIAGNEGKPIGNLYFAGEHTNSFYVWQGFMEGAALSGIDTANAVLAAAR